jgi:hypothetical protein
MRSSYTLRNRLFLVLSWVVAFWLLEMTEASEQDMNLGPGLYYVELPGMTYFGRLEDAQIGRQTGRICRIELNGHNRKEIYVFKDEEETPDSLAVDETTGRIYFSSGKKQGNNTYQGKIQRINTDGTDLKTIITTSALPSALRLVHHPNKKMLYWVEGVEGTLIRRYNINNRTGIETLVDTEKNPCSVVTPKCPPIQDIAVDTENSDIYWTQSLRFTLIPGSIHRLSLLTKPGETSANRTGVQMVLKNQHYPKKMHYVNGTLYWTDEMHNNKGSNLKRLSVLDWGKKDPETLLQTPVQQEGQIIGDFTVNTDSSKIWANVGYTLTHLYSASLTGGGLSPLRMWMAHSQSLVYVK